MAPKQLKARWQSGYAADCNSVYAGSIPTRASIFARLVELVDTQDLKSCDRLDRPGSSPGPGTISK